MDTYLPPSGLPLPFIIRQASEEELNSEEGRRLIAETGETPLRIDVPHTQNDEVNRMLKQLLDGFEQTMVTLIDECQRT